MTSETLTTRASWAEPAVAAARAILRADGERARTQRDAVFAFLVRVASAGLLYLTQIALARWMGSYDYGIYVFVWTWVLVLGGLSHLGLNMAMIRLVPEYQETGELDRLRGLLFGGRIFAVVLSTLIAIAGVAAVNLWPGALASPYGIPALLALVCLPMYVLGDVQDGIGRGRAWMGIGLLPPYVLRPLLVLLTMLAAQAIDMPMVAATAVKAAILATWLSTILQTALVERQLGREIPAGPRTYHWRTWLVTSLPLLVIGFSEIVLQNTDVLVVSRYLTPADVAIYFAAAKTMSLIMFVHYAVGSAVANRFSAVNARGDRDALESWVGDAVHWTFWPSLAAAALILSLGWPMLWLFGPQFTAGYPVMAILAVGFLVRASFGPSEFVLNMLGEQRICAAVLASAAALDIVLAFVLVPRLGITGAALATALALVSASMLNYWVARRRLGLETSIVMRGLKHLRRAR